MKEFIKKQETKSNRMFGYVFRCDDKKRPKEFGPDIYCELWEFEKLTKMVELFESLNLKYDLVIENFDNTESTITSEINIKQDNYINEFMKS